MLWLLLLNSVVFGMHIYVNYETVFYFCQLTNLTQILVCLNFFLSIVLHDKKSTLNTRRFLSSLHLMTLSI